MHTQRHQSGYLLEIPLLLMAISAVLVIAVPNVPVPFAKLLVSCGGLAWIAGLFYMVVIPGWQPGGTVQRVGKLALFLLLAGLIAGGTGAYVVAA